MIDAFAIVDRLSTYTLGGLVTLILVCSFFKLWVWGSDLTAMQSDYEKRLIKQELATEWWKTMALRATSLSENTVDIVKKSNGHG